MRMNAKWKEHEVILKQNEFNKNNSSIQFRACLGMDFDFMLDLEYVNFHKTLEIDRATPKAITATLATICTWRILTAARTYRIR